MDQKLVFKINYSLMLVKSIAECSKGSILQYFRPSLSYHLLLRHLFCLFLSGRLRQVLLLVVFLRQANDGLTLYSGWVVLIAYVQKPPLNLHADVSSGTRGLNFGLNLYLHPYSVYASNKGSV